MKMNGKEPYIHLTWHQSIADSVNYNDADVKKVYKNYATRKKRALNNALGMNTSEAGKIVAQVTSFYDLIENRGGELEKNLLDVGLTAARKAKAISPKALESYTGKIVTDKKWMDQTLKKLQGLLSVSDGFNEELIKYFEEKAINPTALSTRGINVSDLKIMDLEKKTGTSLNSLKRDLSSLESITRNYGLPIEPQFVSKIDKLLPSTGNKPGSIERIIRGAGQRVLNTQGFFLEAVIWGLLEGALQDQLIQGLKTEGLTVEQVGGQNAKTDVALKKVLENGDKVNIGFSMKATEKGITKKGFYGKHPMYKFFEMAKILNKEEEYLFSNLLASGKSRLDVSKIMNRYIAAKASWEAVTGGDGDEIYFFVYLNKIVSADEMFSNMAKGLDPSFRLEITGVTKIKDWNVRMEDAHTRSHFVLDAIRKMQDVKIITEQK